MNNEIFWGFSPTAWIAILTLAIAVAAIIQVAIYRGMHATTKRVERAYVTMSHHRPGLRFGFIGFGSDDPVSKQDVTVTMKICNYGNTPARITRVLVQPIVAIEPLPAVSGLPKYDETLADTVEAVLVKGDHFDYPKPMKVVYDELRTVKSLKNNVAECKFPLRLFIIGYVDYIDRFNVRHKAGYARVYNVWVDSKDSIQPDDPAVTDRAELHDRFKNRNNLVFMGQAGYNYDTEIDEDGNPRTTRAIGRTAPG